MNATTLTVADVVREVRRLAAESPENRYTISGDRCHYAKGECSNGSIGCVVGQGLTALGLGDRIAQIEDDFYANACAVDGLVSVAADDVIEFMGLGDSSHAAARWLRAVQNKQDMGATWGDAVAFADRVYPGVWRN